MAKFILKRECGLTTRGWRILLSPTTLTPDPVPGTWSPSVPPAHTDSHRRLNSLPAQPVENRKRKTKEPCSKGYKNDADRRACHTAPNSWKTNKVYAGESSADQESR